MIRHEQQALLQFVQGVQSDLGDYRILRDQLDAQFDAALRHDVGRLSTVAATISALCEAMEQRRGQRTGFMATLASRAGGTPDRPHVATLFAQIPRPHRFAVESAWLELERLVSECKSRNSRNCSLLMEQHAIMQRVLETESDVYAPV